MRGTIKSRARGKDIAAAIGATAPAPPPKAEKKSKAKTAKTGEGKTADLAESIEAESGEGE